MIEAMIGAVAEKLHGVFGGDYQIHMEKVTQGLVQPCFYIAVRQVTTEPLLGTRKRREVRFDIQYYPLGGNAELYKTGETLTREMAYITEKTDGSILRGKHISYEIAEDILHFYVSYGMIATERIDMEGMETLHMRTSACR